MYHINNFNALNWINYPFLATSLFFHCLHIFICIYFIHIYDIYFDIKVLLSFLDPETFFIPSIESFSFKYHCDNIEISINAMYYIIDLEHFLPPCPLPHLCAYMWSYAISWVIFYEQIMYMFISAVYGIIEVNMFGMCWKIRDLFLSMFYCMSFFYFIVSVLCLLYSSIFYILF